MRGLKAVRTVKPPNNNWLLFAAMVEVTLRFAGEQWEKERVDYAIHQHEAWYLGDGTYGDGPEFHWDYYNSFVIHPFLLQIFDRVAESDDHWHALRPKIQQRATRYAAIQERLISPEGTYPAIGRSLAYRCGAFHLLADMSLREALPPGSRATASPVCADGSDAPLTRRSADLRRARLAHHRLLRPPA